MESYTYLLLLAIILLSTKVFGLLTERVHLPQVVGALLAGIIMGPSGFGVLESTDFLVKAAEIGVIMLMFTAGIDTDMNELKETGVQASVIAVLGVFTPLMRNHSALGTREQECYQFEDLEDFRHVLGVRYRLLPYLYSEYMKAALGGDMLFKPLAFVYPGDKMAAQTEDQMMFGDEIMLAPVYTQNASGRYVYLPEEMLFVKFLPGGAIRQETLAPGHHYVEIALNEVPMFIRRGRCVPLAEPAETVGAVDASRLTTLGYEGASYVLYEDDGVHKNYTALEDCRTLQHPAR